MVHIKAERLAIKAEIIVTNDYDFDLEFAFYLYNGDDKIKVAWYSASPEITFDIGKKTGDFYVLGFVRIKKAGVKSSSRSKLVSILTPDVVQRRYIRLKEWPCSQNLVKTPTKDYIRKTEGLIGQQYSLNTCRNGFALSKAVSYGGGYTSIDEKWVFLGASFIESLFVENGKRFQDFLEQYLKANSRKDVCILNGGYSGATSLHSLNSLINKVLPLKPTKVFFNVCAHNDANALKMSHTYWTEDNLKSPIVPTKTNEPRIATISDLHLMDLNLILNLVKSAVLESGSELYIGTIPYRKDYENDPFLQERYKARNAFEYANEARHKVNEFVRLWCKRNSVNIVDLESELVPFDEYSYDELHLNESGSEKLARILFEHMEGPKSE